MRRVLSVKVTHVWASQFGVGPRGKASESREFVVKGELLGFTFRMFKWRSFYVEFFMPTFSASSLGVLDGRPKTSPIPELQEAEI